MGANNDLLPKIVAIFSQFSDLKTTKKKNI